MSIRLGMSYLIMLLFSLPVLFLLGFLGHWLIGVPGAVVAVAGFSFFLMKWLSLRDKGQTPV